MCFISKAEDMKGLDDLLLHATTLPTKINA